MPIFPDISVHSVSLSLLWECSLVSYKTLNFLPAISTWRITISLLTHPPTQLTQSLDEQLQSRSFVFLLRLWLLSKPVFKLTSLWYNPRSSSSGLNSMRKRSIASDQSTDTLFAGTFQLPNLCDQTWPDLAWCPQCHLSLFSHSGCTWFTSVSSGVYYLHPHCSLACLCTAWKQTGPELQCNILGRSNGTYHPGRSEMKRV